MMRYAAIFTVILAHFIGQWFCCCAPERLLAAVKPVDQANTSDCDSCPYCKQPTPEPQKQAPLRPICPCEWKPRIELTTAEAKTLIFDLVSPTTNVLWIEPTEILSIPATVADCKASELPFLTTEQRLYAHHALRC